VRFALRAPPDSPNRGCFAAYPRLCSPLSSTLGVSMSILRVITSLLCRAVFFNQLPRVLSCTASARFFSSAAPDRAAAMVHFGHFVRTLRGRRAWHSLVPCSGSESGAVKTTANGLRPNKSLKCVTRCALHRTRSTGAASQLTPGCARRLAPRYMSARNCGAESSWVRGFCQ